MTTQTPTETRELVREHYGQVARTDGACGCGPGCCGGGATASTDLGYDAAELADLPKGADMGLGCGTPLAFAALREGEVVIDLGSLEFMAASCFNVLVGWIGVINDLPVEQRYQLRFSLNSAVPWQRRSLATLSCFATDIVKVGER